VLIALLYASGTLVDEHVRAGLSAERFGEVFSSLIVDGLRAPFAPSPSHEGKQ
jgi:hypothetical protein